MPTPSASSPECDILAEIPGDSRYFLIFPNLSLPAVKGNIPICGAGYDHPHYVRPAHQFGDKKWAELT